MSIMLIWHPRHLLILCFQHQEPIRTFSCLKQKQSSQVMNNLISLGIWMWISHKSIGCKAAVSAFRLAECPRGNAYTSVWIKGTRAFHAAWRIWRMRCFSKYRRHLVGNKHNNSAHLQELIGYTYLLGLSLSKTVTTWAKFEKCKAMQWENKEARVTSNNWKQGLQHQPVRECSQQYCLQ